MHPYAPSCSREKFCPVPCATRRPSNFAVGCSCASNLESALSSVLVYKSSGVCVRARARVCVYGVVCLGMCVQLLARKISAPDCDHPPHSSERIYCHLDHTRDPLSGDSLDTVPTLSPMLAFPYGKIYYTVLFTEAMYGSLRFPSSRRSRVVLLQMCCIVKACITFFADKHTSDFESEFRWFIGITIKV